MSRTKSDLNICPKCGADIIMVEYPLVDPNHYDGVSEYACIKALTSNGKDCDYKIGRFCGQRLSWKEQEMRYCKGAAHPTHE